MDFLIVPTAGFRLLIVLVILRHPRRRLISLSVTANPTAQWIARQITEAFPWDEAPDYLIRDRDAYDGHAVTRRLAAMGIRDHPTAARSPWQNGHAERLIGSIRRECLDHSSSSARPICAGFLLPMFLTTTIFERICRSTRIRPAIDRSDGSVKSPLSRSSADFIMNIVGRSIQQGHLILGGLHHQYRRTLLSVGWLSQHGWRFR
jgi:transposase InsO family protein